MRKTLVGTAVGCAALVALAASALADTGPQSFVVFGDSDQPTVVANGPISGIGTDVESATEPSGTFVFPTGSVDVDHPPTGGESGFVEPACVGVENFGGVYGIEGGTGAYEGASGGGTYHGVDVAILPRTDEGCGDEPTFGFVALVFSGTTTLP